MNVALQNLMKLQALQFKEVEASAKEIEAQTAELRALIPPPIMGHYDRLVVRGKKGIAVIRNQTCSGCHMRQPLGTITVLMRGEDLQLCDSCGRYLYVEPGENPTIEKAPEVKPQPKPRARRKKADPLVAAS
jgi:predicted  nucleic acid-binding Zn-ribbon protein